MQREDGAVSSCALGFIPAGTGNTFIGEALGVKTAGARDAAVRAAVQAWAAAPRASAPTVAAREDPS